MTHVQEDTPCDRPHEKLREELEALKAIGPWCTPEFLLRATRPTEGTERVKTAEPETASTVGGRVSIRGSLLDVSAVEGLVHELRGLLERGKAHKRSEEPSQVLELWTLVEPHLLEGEAPALFDAVLKHVFGETTSPTLTRARHRVGGGR